MSVSAQRNKRQQGFTIIELMMATTVFAVILLIISFGIAAIGRLYFKSNISTRIQESNRSVVEDISRTIQFGNSSVLSMPDPTLITDNPADPHSVCIGDTRYTYILDRPVSTDALAPQHALWVDKLQIPGVCPVDLPDLSRDNPSNFNTALTGTAVDGGGAPTSGKELLGKDMRVLGFDVDLIGGTVYKINVRIAYGDSEYLTHYDNAGVAVDLDGDAVTGDRGDFRAAICRSTSQGGAYCAISELDTTIKKRIN